jgi:amino acid transporter
MSDSAVAQHGAPRIEVREVTRKLGLAGIVGIIFFSVSGGPYGLEDTIGESGAGIGLLLILITPLIWSLPTSLMVAEMATMMPVQGGYYQWVKTGLGEFWGFCEGWWSWVVSWVDLAIYPVLFVDYASYFFPELGTNAWLRWSVCVVVIWGLALVNMRGASVVGDSSKIFLIVVIAPFLIVTIIGLLKMKYSPFDPVHPPGVGIGPAFGAGLFVIMWNYMGWDGLSTVAGEIENPRRNYPRALAITIPLITILYLVPTLVSLAVVGTDNVEWTAGAYNLVAEEVGGKWLGTVMSITALVSAVGLFSAWLLSYSRIPFALSDDGWLPPALSKLHPRFGTPTFAIVVAAIICSAAATGPFQSLVAIDVTVYACALMLEFAALIAMRRKYPDLARPFRVPGGWFGVSVITLLPALVIVAAVYYQVKDVGAVQGIGWAAAALLTGPLAYVVLRPSRRKRGIDKRVELATGELVDVGIVTNAQHTNAQQTNGQP